MNRFVQSVVGLLVLALLAGGAWGLGYMARGWFDGSAVLAPAVTPTTGPAMMAPTGTATVSVDASATVAVTVNATVTAEPTLAATSTPFVMSAPTLLPTMTPFVDLAPGEVSIRVAPNDTLFGLSRAHCPENWPEDSEPPGLRHYVQRVAERNELDTGTLIIYEGQDLIMLSCPDN